MVSATGNTFSFSLQVVVTLMLITVSRISVVNQALGGGQVGEASPNSIVGSKGGGGWCWHPTVSAVSDARAHGDCQGPGEGSQDVLQCSVCFKDNNIDYLIISKMVHLYWLC